MEMSPVSHHDYSTREHCPINANDQPTATTKFIEADYVDNTPIKLDKDIYDLVIGANENRIFTPTEEKFAIGQCMLCFMIQVYCIYAFVSDSLTFDNFQPFLMKHMSLRFLLCFLYAHMF